MGLFSEFKASKKIDWEAAIQSSSNGKPLESLHYKIGELEFPIIQMEDESDGGEPSLNFEKEDYGSENQTVKSIPWLRVNWETNLESINPILKDLESKAIFEIGLEINELKEEVLRELFSGIERRELKKVHIYLPLFTFKQAETVLKILDDLHFPPNRIGLISPDIVSLLLSSGDISPAIAWLENVQIRFPGVPALLFDTGWFIPRGVYPYEELAIMFGMLPELMNMANRSGIPFENVFGHSRFRISVGNLFMEGVSKIRIWESVGNAVLRKLGLNQNHRIRVEVIPSKFSMGIFDVENNLLRQSSQMMVGIFGGSDVFHIYPYNEAREASSAMGSRTSSNLIFLLKDEARLAVVASPLRGCYFLDHLNEKLANKAWELFQVFQAEGGMFRSKSFMGLLKSFEVRKIDRQEKYFRVEIPQVGENLFPNRKEKVPPEKESYVRQYLNDVDFMSKDLDQLRLSNAVLKKALLLMLGRGSRRFGDANVAGNILGSIGIESQIIENIELESCDPIEYEFMVLVGEIQELDQDLVDRCKSSGFKNIGILSSGDKPDIPAFFEPGFILDPNCPLDLVLKKILKKT
jgi:Methylmalonyl-CoA mutase